MKTKLNLLVAVMFLAATSSALATVRYVNVNNANPTPPYTNWATAATNIQDAVNAAGAGDEIVVTNGTYAGGSYPYDYDLNCVGVDKPLVLSSVNGPDVTVIDGGGWARCLYLTNNAVMVGFTLTNGAAYIGGGVCCESTSAVLTNCVLTGNWAGHGGAGGGAFGGTLNNCTLTGNSASGYRSLEGDYDAGLGGGACYSTLNNCTLTGNGTSDAGGGAYSSTLNNCIVYFNSDPSDDGGNCDPSSTLSYCCTTPMPTSGVGNNSANPQLASASHLSAESPCIGAGSATYASGTDIDGEAWANPPSIGCDEYHAGAVTGPLTVSLTATLTNVATGFSVGLTAFIEGRTDLSVWDFGDGSVVSNRPYASHAWTSTGDYPVTLRAYNDTYPGGVAASVTVHVLAQPLYYVALSSTSPVAPYSSWATAANNIQDAVYAASVPGALVPGALVLVTNGTYGPVTIYTPLTVQSVNGPDATVIDGEGTSRCLYLANNALMVGFTLTNGVASPGNYNGVGGGVYCESTSAVLTNCVLTGNSAQYVSGGGAYAGTLNNCTLTGNSANLGGGAFDSTLNNCTLTSNSAYYGGGAYGCTLNNCTLTGNSAPGGYGGGACDSMLNSCSLSGNSAFDGGGAYGDSFQPCTLNNCTLTGNAASDAGGGAYSSTLNNCIVYFNSDPNGGNYDPSCTLNYCCTTPMPTNGVGNISADPDLASASHISAWSPCIGAGSANYASGTDIDGEAWANPPSIGCDEYHAGAVTGPLTVSLTSTFTNVATGFPLGLTAFIAGRTDLSVWDFGDGYVQVNEPYTSHTWTALGDYLVALWVFNDSYPGGVSAMVTVHVENGLHYVAATSGNPVSPYASWATAATNIQDAVDVAGAGGTVFVTNGTYAGGSQVDPYGDHMCVVVDKPLTLQSVNGPGVTVINGGGIAGCLYLTNDAVMVGFTLTNGAAYSGGGVFGGMLNNCTLTDNSALEEGGGADYSTLNNCKLTGNSAPGGYGGGAYDCTLNNCTLTGNSAPGGYGGAGYDCTLNNCIVYFNGGNYAPYSTLNYCCTTPMPTSGVGNITNAPLFVDYAGGNLRLQSNSPCINSGNNAQVVGSTDLDGNPRIVFGTVDIGAYEYQTPTSIISYAWLQQYGLPTDGSADHADLDGTGMNVYQDWVAGLNPTNALSVLKMTSATKTNNPAGLVVTWESVNTRTYYLQRGTNLGAQPSFSTIQSNIVGQAGTTSYTDTNAVGSGPYFYRVGVAQ